MSGRPERFLDKLQNSPPVTLVAIGDSITEVNWHTRGQLNWVGLLQEAFMETYGRGKVWVVNTGISGDGATGVLGRLERDVLRFAPDLAIVSVGMNHSADDVDGFADSLARIVERIQAESDAYVVLRTPNPIIEYPGVEVDSAMAVIARAIVRLAAEHGCAVVDHYSLWKQLMDRPEPLTELPNRPWLWMSDPVHPGPIGHRLFYNQLAPQFGLPVRFPWEE
jgi:acyl-CoA thioesterase I